MHALTRTVYGAATASAQRFEAKYRVDEMTAAMIRAYMAPFVRADESADANNSYVINSLYLDAPSLRLFRSSATGEKNRIKLRIRTYAADFSGRVHLEVKRRQDQIVSKERVCIAGEYVPSLLADYGVDRSAYDDLDARGRVSLDNFRYLAARYAVKPVTWVRYEREAYVGAFGEPLRITFDRQLQFQGCHRDEVGRCRAAGPWEEGANRDPILEIKFTDRAPAWVQEMIRRFDLTRQSISKYVICTLGLQRLGYVVPNFQKEDE